MTFGNYDHTLACIYLMISNDNFFFRIWKEFTSMMNLLVKDRDWQKLTVPNWLKSMTKFSKSSIVLIHTRTKSWRSNSNSNCLSEVPLPSSYFNKSVPSKKCSPSSKKKRMTHFFFNSFSAVLSSFDYGLFFLATTFQRMKNTEIWLV